MMTAAAAMANNYHYRRLHKPGMGFQRSRNQAKPFQDFPEWTENLHDEIGLQEVERVKKCVHPLNRLPGK